MPKIAIQDQKAGRRIVDGHSFVHYVANVAEWFTYHRMPGSVDLHVSHKRSGMRVAVVGPTRQLAHLSDDKGACAAELDRLIKQAGEARVRSVLAGAPDLPPYQAKNEAQS